MTLEPVKWCPRCDQLFPRDKGRCPKCGHVQLLRVPHPFTEAIEKLEAWLDKHREGRHARA